MPSRGGARRPALPLAASGAAAQSQAVSADVVASCSRPMMRLAWAQTESIAPNISPCIHQQRHRAGEFHSGCHAGIDQNRFGPLQHVKQRRAALGRHDMLASSNQEFLDLEATDDLKNGLPACRCP